jgi:hypothetical protein
MKTTQVTYGIQRSAERSSAKYAYDKAEITITLEEGDTAEAATEAARAQCEAAIARAEHNDMDARLRELSSTPRGRAQLQSFLRTIP